jgi:hypothetical protein
MANNDVPIREKFMFSLPLPYGDEDVIYLNLFKRYLYNFRHKIYVDDELDNDLYTTIIEKNINKEQSGLNNLITKLSYSGEIDTNPLEYSDLIHIVNSNKIATSIFGTYVDDNNKKDPYVNNFFESVTNGNPQSDFSKIMTEIKQIFDLYYKVEKTNESSKDKFNVTSKIISNNITDSTLLLKYNAVLKCFKPKGCNCDINRNWVQPDRIEENFGKQIMYYILLIKFVCCVNKKILIKLMHKNIRAIGFELWPCITWYGLKSRVTDTLSKSLSLIEWQNYFFTDTSVTLTPEEKKIDDNKKSELVLLLYSLYIYYSYFKLNICSTLEYVLLKNSIMTHPGDLRIARNVKIINFTLTAIVVASAIAITMASVGQAPLWAGALATVGSTTVTNTAVALGEDIIKNKIKNHEFTIEGKKTIEELLSSQDRTLSQQQKPCDKTTLVLRIDAHNSIMNEYISQTNNYFEQYILFSNDLLSIYEINCAKGVEMREALVQGLHDRMILQGQAQDAIRERGLQAERQVAERQRINAERERRIAIETDAREKERQKELAIEEKYSRGGKLKRKTKRKKQNNRKTHRKPQNLRKRKTHKRRR